MAITVTKGTNFTEIKLSTTDNFDSVDEFPDGVVCSALKFVGSADNDKVIIREGSLTGPVMFVGITSEAYGVYHEALQKDSPFGYRKKVVHMCVNSGEVTLSNPAVARLVIEH